MTPRLSTAEEIRAWLLARLAALLGMQEAEVALADSVDELGIDSLTIARVTEDLREILGVELPPTLFYEASNLADLIARIAAASAEVRGGRHDLLKIKLAATFTAEPIEEPLNHLLGLAGLAADIVFAPYNQVFQQLLDPLSDFCREPAAARVVLVRGEDWFRYAKHPQTAEKTLDFAGQLGNALTAARARLDGPLLVVLCPQAKETAESSRAHAVMLAAVEAIAGIECVDLARLAIVYPEARLFDPSRDRLGHIPYSPEGYAALATKLGRRLHHALRPAKKVLVVDCDETLWQGVIGEDGVEGIRFGAGHLALQEFLLERKHAGQVLALASKNSEADVLAVFQARPEMRLNFGDTVARRIDWHAKPENLRSIADELRLSLDSFIFIDDSLAECAAMRALLPMVTVVQLPRNPSVYGQFLRNHWAFDTKAATDEDRRRTDLYQEARARRDLEQQSGNADDFIAALNVEVTVRAIKAAEVSRAAQLTQRTNQFNTTTIRHDETAVARIISVDSFSVLGVHVQDRFGDYGFVGLAVLDWSGGRCTVDNLLLSCRVLGRRVEHALLSHVAELAAARGLESLRIRFAATARNQPAQRFLESLGKLEENGLDLNLADLPSALARAEVTPAAAFEQTDKASARVASAVASEGLDWIAALAAPSELVKDLADRIGARPELDTPYLAPRTTLQNEIARIWRQVLRLDRVGIEDDFFALGGDSLAGATMVAELYGIGLPEHVGISVIERPTIAGLSQAIEDVRQGRAPTLVTSLASLEAAASLPDDLRALCTRLGASYVARPATKYLLTGATGYVGAHLAAELLTRPDVRLVCHLRAKDSHDGWRRLRGNFERYGLWHAEFADRIDLALGKLDAPRLGLPDAAYERFAQDVDAVIHNGARVNFIMPFSHLASANVEGTLEALRFAAHGRVKPLHFVSTLGVLMSGYCRDHVITENRELDRSEDLPNGYEQTKWVADKMVWHAIQTGYPAAIYRLGMLSGLSGSGAYHKLDEFLPSFLKGCVQLGSFPHLDSKIEMVPVDVVTGALARIIGQPDAIGRAFHLNHPQAITDEDFVDWLREYGYSLRFLPWDVWKRELFGAGDRLRENALYPFLDFIRGLQAHQTRIPEMDMTNFREFAAAEASACPSQRVLLRRYFDHFVEVGYLRAPSIFADVDK